MKPEMGTAILGFILGPSAILLLVVGGILLFQRRRRPHAEVAMPAEHCPRCHGKGFFYDAAFDQWFECDHKRLYNGRWFA